MDRNKKELEDMKANWDRSLKKSEFVMVNGRTITVDQYKSDPDYWNDLPIDPEYLKTVWDDYSNTH